jgi:hypothetical protein
MFRLCGAAAAVGLAFVGVAAAAEPAPAPLLAAGKPVAWWFAYKFNAASFPSKVSDPPVDCRFGGTLQSGAFSQHYAYASKDHPGLVDGGAKLLGRSLDDPLGATFDQIYSGAFYYVVWNDQFYGSPTMDRSACADDEENNCVAPWGHAKGMLAWNTKGEGVVLQVTTPDWPGAGSAAHPRKESEDYPKGQGNTLGCVVDNNVSNAQHFFALKLSAADVKAVLRGLDLASVVTETHDPQVVNTVVGGKPLTAEMQGLVNALEKTRASPAVGYSDVKLSSGVRLIVKPSALNVPPWQFVSWRLGGADLRTATWWAAPRIPSTKDASDVACWPEALKTAGAMPAIGKVEVATTGTWNGVSIGLKGGQNHAKIGVSTSGVHPYAVFGDLNQQGKLSGKCSSSQNGRGGMFFVVEDAALAAGVRGLIAGDTAPFAK